jgi:hypothetical protein
MEQAAHIHNEVTYPLPQPKPLKVVAKVISYVFHPLFIPVFVSAYIIYLHPYLFAGFDSKQKFIRLISVFVITAFFPAITVFLLWRLQFAESIYLRTQKERIIPFVASIIYFFWAFWVSRNLAGTPPAMTFFFLGVFLSTSAALMANNYFKISLHGLAVGGAVAFMVLLGMITSEPMGKIISITTLIAGLVSTSRLIVSDHHPMEVYWGLILGGLCQFIAFYFIIM